MEVNVYCGKELLILEIAGVLHTPLLQEKMKTSHFLLLCCVVKKCTLEHTGDFHIHFENGSEIIGLPVLGLASSYYSFVYNNPRSNSGVFSSMKQFNSARKTCEGVHFLVTLQACYKVSKVGPVLLWAFTQISQFV